MCGIVGISAKGGALALDTVGLVLEGLRRLEYRGYDSAGVAAIVDGQLERCRCEGKLAALIDKIESEGFLDLPAARGSVAIGHTRWATHGKPCEGNAHPHVAGRVAVVHNGIIENYIELRAEVVAERGRDEFRSETDTEVIAHLFDLYLEKGKTPEEAFPLVLARLKGAFSIVAVVEGEGELLLAARRGTPLVLGRGEEGRERSGEVYFASDATALAALTRELVYLEDGDWVCVRGECCQVFDQSGTSVERPVVLSELSKDMVEKGRFPHFMLKEIYDQPHAIKATLERMLHPTTGEVRLPRELVERICEASHVTIVACGTAYYAALASKYWFERLAGISVEVDFASEFRYREPPLRAGGIALFVSQSGETLDTLEALRYCRRQGQFIASVLNREQSTMARESDVVVPTLAGVEIGVASTKAFTTQVLVLAVVALEVARAAGRLSTEETLQNLAALKHLPALIGGFLQAGGEAVARNIARQISERPDVFFLGRGSMYPLALEGALKLKEISYLHAEGFAAGEMKHGVIALIEAGVPVVVMAPCGGNALFDKMVASVQEVVARGGEIALISDVEGCEKLKDSVVWSVAMPACEAFVAPALYAVPLQLLAYHVAVARGKDPDQPRNLAKSVTVE